MNKKVILVWFRNDLRTLDNEVLHDAVEKSDFVIPVYIFDPRYYEQNNFGFQNTGVLRQQFIQQSVFALKTKLQNLGGDLLTYIGLPEEIIPHLVQKYDVDEVYHHREVAQRETSISEAVEEALWKIKRNLKHFIGHTLYHKEDLPFPIKDIPDDFNKFKKKIAKESFVRPIIQDIEKINLPPHMEKTDFPYELPKQIAKQKFGDHAATILLSSLMNDSDFDGEGYYQLTPYISVGAISAAYIYHYLQSKMTNQNKKTINAFLENLLMRDYFRFMLKKHPNCYFKCYNGSKIDYSIMETWITGKTDVPAINHAIQKLNNEGILNTNERQLLALHFIYELQQPWSIGAAWFEQQLIDYAPATNYGFWAHMAGQGTSSKNNKTETDWHKLKEQLIEQINK